MTRPVVLRADSAGCSTKIAEACGDRNVGYSLVARRNDAIDAAIAAVAVTDKCWQPAIKQNGDVRPGAVVADLTDYIDTSDWPEGTRLIVRREPPTPQEKATKNTTNHPAGQPHAPPHQPHAPNNTPPHPKPTIKHPTNTQHPAQRPQQEQTHPQNHSHEQSGLERAQIGGGRRPNLSVDSRFEPAHQRKPLSDLRVKTPGQRLPASALRSNSQQPAQRPNKQPNHSHGQSGLGGGHIWSRCHSTGTPGSVVVWWLLLSVTAAPGPVAVV